MEYHSIPNILCWQLQLGKENCTFQLTPFIKKETTMFTFGNINEINLKKKYPTDLFNVTINHEEREAMWYYP
jgi:hypothetical protein